MYGKLKSMEMNEGCVFLLDYAIWPPNRQSYERLTSLQVQSVKAQNGYNAAQLNFVEKFFLLMHLCIWPQKW